MMGPREDEHGKCLLLRVDVDFHIGLKRGVPALLDDLREYGAHAGFYVVMGPDTMHLHTSRLRKKGYIKRLISLNPLKIIREFGVRQTILGRFLPPRPVGPSCPGVMERTAAEGHDLGLHGYNHHWWTENAFGAGFGRLRQEIEQGWAAFVGVTGKEPVTWVSPNWRTTDEVVRYIAEKKVPYLSECRGRFPFFTLLDDGDCIGIPHLPVNLPALHELRQSGFDARASVEELLKRMESNAYNMLVVHGYYEGVLARSTWRLLLERLARQAYRIISPSEYLKENEASLKNLPPCRLRVAAYRGGILHVSHQDTADHQAP